MRTPFRTTLDDDLLTKIKHKAITDECNVNDIIEKALYKYLNTSILIGEMSIKEYPYDKQFEIIKDDIQEKLFNVADNFGIILHGEICDAVCLETNTLAKLYLGEFNEFTNAE